MEDAIFDERIDEEVLADTFDDIREVDSHTRRQKLRRAIDVVAAQVTNRRQKVERSKRTATNVATHLAFVVIVFVYSAAGGLLFRELEEVNDILMCNSARKQYLQSVEEGVKAINNIRTDFTLTIEERLQSYESTLETIRDSFINSTWDGTDCDTMVSNWNFFGASVWCLTTITTVGYGHIAPKTTWGKIVLIAYSVFGLPLTLVALAKIGDFLAEIAKFSYHVLCCCAACREEKRFLNKADKKRLVRNYFKENYSEFYIQAASAAAVSHQDDPQRQQFYEIFGKSETESSDGLESEELDLAKLDLLDHVPWHVSCFIILATIYVGGSIFSSSEEWPILDAIYFSFITVSTIGFGDLYPDLANQETVWTRLRFTIWGLFIFFGLAIMSMCLNMIQIDVGGKVAALIAVCSQVASDEAHHDTSDSEDEIIDENGLLMSSPPRMPVAVPGFNADNAVQEDPIQLPLMEAVFKINEQRHSALPFESSDMRKPSTAVIRHEEEAAAGFQTYFQSYNEPTWQPEETEIQTFSQSNIELEEIETNSEYSQPD